MANQKQFNRLLSSIAKKNGWRAWNQWQQENAEAEVDLRFAQLGDANLSFVDLRHADLSDANLLHANLHRANLGGANLSRANLSRAALSYAHLPDANLSGAHLSRATFVGADLSHANLSGADLSGASLNDVNLSRATLTLANLTGARIGNTLVANLDLRGVQGLETIIHRRSSTVGIDTLYRSQGQIPEVFLHGCGVADEFLRLMKQLRYEAVPRVRPLTVFISYSRADMSFVDALDKQLQNHHLSPWIDRGRLEGGQLWLSEIQQAIDDCDLMLAVLSPDAIQSQFVQAEYNYARQEEKPIIPLDYRPCKLPLALSTLHAVDFRTVPQEQAMENLLRAIERYRSK